jgi:endoglucanase
VVGSNKWQIPSTFPDLRIPEDDANIILSFHFYSPLALTHYLAPWGPVAEYKGEVNYPGQIVDTSHYKELSEKTVAAMREYANGYFTKDTLAKIMSPAIKVAKDKNLPLFCGEYGVYPTIPEDIALRWYKDVCDIFNANNIAYCHWCYKGDFPVVDENSVPNRRLIGVLKSK